MYFENETQAELFNYMMRFAETDEEKEEVRAYVFQEE